MDDGAAGDVGDEGAFFRQDAEFGGAYQVVGVIAVGGLRGQYGFHLKLAGYVFG